MLGTKISRLAAILSLLLATIGALSIVVECSAQNAIGEKLFPTQVQKWMASEKEQIAGVAKAEALRSKLLMMSPVGKPYSELICEQVAGFQQSVSDSHLANWRVGQFNMSAQRLSDQLSGKQSIALDAFDAFNGRWFGQWEKNDVNHDWRPTEIYHPPKSIAPQQPPVAALQYAWISNGFGWNYLSSLDGSGQKNYILGIVYYFEAPNYEIITGEAPHVGFFDSPTRLIWITEQAIYLEEVFAKNLKTPAGELERYQITGLHHNLLSDKPVPNYEAVQATYTRDPENRPAFKKLNWQRVSPKNKSEK